MPGDVEWQSLFSEQEHGEIWKKRGHLSWWCFLYSISSFGSGSCQLEGGTFVAQSILNGQGFCISMQLCGRPWGILWRYFWKRPHWPFHGHSTQILHNPRVCLASLNSRWCYAATHDMIIAEPLHGSNTKTLPITPIAKTTKTVSNKHWINHETCTTVLHRCAMGSAPRSPTALSRLCNMERCGWLDDWFVA